MMRTHIPLLGLVACLVVLTGCGGDVVVDPATPTSFPASKISGRYAIVIDSGRWKFDTKRSGGEGCPAYSFTFEVDRAFEESVRRFVAGTVEAVDYLSLPLSRQALVEGRYRAQIIFREGPVSLRANRGKRAIIGESSVTVSVFVLWPDQDVSYNFEAVGEATEIQDAPADCSLIGEVTARSLQSAVSRAMEQSMAKIAGGLAAHKGAVGAFPNRLADRVGWEARQSGHAKED
jgi:hypothetical protein